MIIPAVMNRAVLSSTNANSTVANGIMVKGAKNAIVRLLRSSPRMSFCTVPILLNLRLTSVSYNKVTLSVRVGFDGSVFDTAVDRQDVCRWHIPDL